MHDFALQIRILRASFLYRLTAQSFSVGMQYYMDCEDASLKGTHLKQKKENVRYHTSFLVKRPDGLSLFINAKQRGNAISLSRTSHIRVDDFHKATEGSHRELNSRETFLLINLRIAMKAGSRSPVSYTPLPLRPVL